MSADSSPNSPASSPASGLREVVPYLLPILVFLGLTSLESDLPDRRWYPIVYSVKVLIVALLLWYYRGTWRDLRPAPRPGAVVLAVVTGLLVYVLWVGLEGWYPTFALLGTRTGLDPRALPAGWKRPFIAVRLCGLVLLVPLMEELFWRSFLIRWLIDPDFLKVKIGRVTPMAAGVSSVVFALSHPEWLPALCTGLLWAWLLWQTKSVSACAISHAVANLALGIHVLATGDWKYW
ncbi:MAG: CAAX prenyl protease-related protein [Isosphaeraceae bacterium]